MRRGLSLAEAVLSMFLVLLVVTLILQLYPMALSSLHLTGQRAQAHALADSVLADLFQKPFADLTVGSAAPLPAVAGEGTTFQPSVEILAVAPPADPNRTRCLRVRVRWQEHDVWHEVIREQIRTQILR